MTAGYDLDSAAVHAMHMYVAMDAQLTALGNIEKLAGDLADTLRRGKMSADLVEALSEVRNRSAKALAMAGKYKQLVEEVQHALTAAINTSAKGT